MTINLRISNSESSKKDFLKPLSLSPDAATGSSFCGPPSATVVVRFTTSMVVKLLVVVVIDNSTKVSVWLPWFSFDVSDGLLRTRGVVAFVVVAVVVVDGD